jgi:hypothetical protein
MYGYSMVSVRQVGNEIKAIKKKLFTAIISLVGLIVLIVGPLKTGPHWDYQTDDYFFDLNLKSLSNSDGFKNDYLYGIFHSYSFSLGFIERIPYLTLRLFGFTDSFNSPIWISYRNVFVAATFLVGVLGLVYWSHYMLNLKPWITFTSILAFPIILGHGWMNEKDFPIFSGVCSALALISVTTTKKSISHLSLNIRIWAGLTVLLTLGVRPASFLVVLPLVCALIAYISTFGHRKSLILKNIFWACAAVGIFIYLTNITFRIDGSVWLLNSLNQSSNFPWYGSMLTWGKTYKSPPPGEYFFMVWISQIPVWAIVTLTVGSVLVFFRYFQKLVAFLIVHKFKLNFHRFTLKNESFWIILVNSYLIGWLYIVFKAEFNLYDDARQLFFLWAFVLCSALNCMSLILRKFKQQKKLVIALYAMMISMVYIDEVKLFPYLYIYRNEISNIASPNGFETDYWGLSSMEASKWLLKYDNLSNGIYFAQPLDSYKPYLSPKLTPSAEPSNIDYYLGVWNPVRVVDPRPDCRTIHQITRSQFIGDLKILSIVKKCERL